MTDGGIISLKPNREKPVINRHPWVFSGAVARVEGDPTPGGIVDVLGSNGQFLARGYWNPTSQIRVRLLTWDIDETIDRDFWHRRLERSITARDQYRYGHSTAYRLVNAENDYIPGLIVDRYANFLVVQALTLGIDQRKAELAELLAEIVKPRGIYERSDADVRRKEGLEKEAGVLWGHEPPGHVLIEENRQRFQVDVRNGHKTGFYLDQSESRYHLFELLREDKIPVESWSVLNLFSYTGGFGVYALAAGAGRVVNVDSSHEALELAEQNVEQNSLEAESTEFIQADVFQLLRDYAAQGEQFDVVVLDPPKFAHSEQQVDRAARGYKDINLNSFRVVKPGGFLFTFSCSGAIDRDLFQKIVFGALADSGRDAQILRHLGAGDDHPVALTFPEGDYLKGLLLRVF